jgi:hypothetical protein
MNDVRAAAGTGWPPLKADFCDREARRQAGGLYAEQIDEPSDAVVAFRLDEKIGRRPSRASNLRADSGVARLQRAVRQIGQ